MRCAPRGGVGRARRQRPPSKLLEVALVGRKPRVVAQQVADADGERAARRRRRRRPAGRRPRACRRRAGRARSGRGSSAAVTSGLVSEARSKIVAASQGALAAPESRDAGRVLEQRCSPRPTSRAAAGLTLPGADRVVEDAATSLQRRQSPDVRVIAWLPGPRRNAAAATRARSRDGSGARRRLPSTGSSSSTVPASAFTRTWQPIGSTAPPE